MDGKACINAGKKHFMGGCRPGRFNVDFKESDSNLSLYGKHTCSIVLAWPACSAFIPVFIKLPFDEWLHN